MEYSHHVLSFKRKSLFYVQSLQMQKHQRFCKILSAFFLVMILIYFEYHYSSILVINENLNFKLDSNLVIITGLFLCLKSFLLKPTNLQNNGWFNYDKNAFKIVSISVKFLIYLQYNLCKILHWYNWSKCIQALWVIGIFYNSSFCDKNLWKCILWLH